MLEPVLDILHQNLGSWHIKARDPDRLGYHKYIRELTKDTRFNKNRKASLFWMLLKYDTVSNSCAKLEKFQIAASRKISESFRI